MTETSVRYGHTPDERISVSTFELPEGGDFRIELTEHATDTSVSFDAATAYALAKALRKHAASARGVRPIGPMNLARWQRMFPRLRLVALGGVNVRTIKSLQRCAIAGIAGIGFGAPLLPADQDEPIGF